ncbi:hypothetical protein ILUMI_04392 [Ignelater luminosus]|uniref:receptor protein-tyrosine kinase n=1 Tax=Ignelater luminosus TaxID=2038154 RepID=A0A8K0DCZ1_IGNLU|nr:hypothetical protein ILUMI_04392 [Ignelater luminosus]
MAHGMSPHRLFVFLIVFVLCVLPTNARICGGVHATSTLNNLENKLRGCTAVVGNLKIVLLENSYSHINNVSFPELKEISGYLLFYRVFGLRSIGTLFPNLAVIRGDILLTNYALIIYNLPDLEEINLYNLQYIETGSTRIERCPKLCFVDEINWDTIGSPSHSVDYFNENEDTCKSCPEKCNGDCWNENRCHEIQSKPCSDHCLACDDQSNLEICISCKSQYYLNEGKCFSECPKTKVKNSETRTCIRIQDCREQFGWLIFQGECMRNCPEGFEFVGEDGGWCHICDEYCKKVCDGGVIENANHASWFRQCTHINGSLIISGSGLQLGQELSKSLGNIREIQGYLKIHKMNALMSLDFLRNLKIIKGERLVGDKYALVITDNSNLHKLWTPDNFTLKIEKGHVYCHYNPQLCLSETERLVNLARISNYSALDISPYSNGDRKNCKEINITVLFENITETSVYVKWDEKVSDSSDDIIGYTLHYSPDPFGNMTEVYEQTECSYTSWNSVFVTRNSLKIYSLGPHTQYVCYIEINTMQRMLGGQTPLKRFRTLSTTPDFVTNARALSTVTSIFLVWNPPEYSYGIVSHYEIHVSTLEDKPYISEERNYCKNPHFFVPEKLVDEIDIPFDFENQKCCKKQEAQSKDPLVKYYLPWYGEKVIITNTTKVQLASLRHFQIYNLLIRACNNAGCSASIMIHKRTKPREEADDIRSNTIIHFVNQTDFILQWFEPVDPNSVIVSYIIEYVRTDKNDFVPNKECVTRSSYINNHRGYVLRNLPSGHYSLTITAVSLAGPGRASKNIQFEILEASPSNGLIILSGCVIAVISILMVISLFFLYLHFKKSQKWKSLSTNASSVESLYELSRNDLDTEILQEATGTICNGFIKSQNRPCTIISGQEYKDNYELLKFLKEVSVMKISNSNHVVDLLGVVSAVQPPLIITELMAWGDLKSFLRKSKDSPERLTDAEMYRMAAEIADGILYLNYKKIIPRDLATRNCLVSAGQTVKIVNFSITKNLYSSDYYQQKENGDLIPLRWMSPESLTDNLFTCNSNIWSFGIILWEIVTFAEQPYGMLSNEDVIKFVIGKQILDLPENCPDLLYEMMVACWRWEPNDRPSFVSLLRQLKSNVSRNFRLVSFYHSKEAGEYKKSVIKDKESESPAIGKRSMMYWNKNEDEDKVRLLSAEELPSQNIPSTSRYL